MPMLMTTILADVRKPADRQGLLQIYNPLHSAFSK